MKLAWKLVLGFYFCFLVAFLVHSALRVEWAIETFEEGMLMEHHLIGRVLGAAVTTAWHAGGEKEILSTLRAANARENEVKINWTLLPSPDGAPDPGASPPREALDAIRQGREVSVFLPEKNQDRRLCTYIPVTLDAQHWGLLQLSESPQPLRQYKRKTFVDALLIAGFLILLCGAGAAFLGFWFVGRPIRALADKARRVGSGDLTGVLSIPQRDEIGALADDFNQMCKRLSEARQKTAAEAAEKLAALQQLRHAERLTTVGRLASGMAHELGTPLNVVAARAKMIAAGEVTGTEAADNARIITQQADKMTRLIRQLLDVARRRPPAKAGVDLRQLAEQTLRLLKPLADKQQVVLALAEGTPVYVEADGPQIEQVLTNLIVNGIQAMPEGGNVTVGVTHERCKAPAELGGQDGEYVRVFVKDEGVGMSAEVRHHVFEPFFTTKDVGEGTGLGLTVSHGLVREHGGWIDVTSQVGEGSCFSVYLPERPTHA